MIVEWFRDRKLPVADAWRKVEVPYYEELAALKRLPGVPDADRAHRPLA